MCTHFSPNHTNISWHFKDSTAIFFSEPGLSMAWHLSHTWLVEGEASYTLPIPCSPCLFQLGTLPLGLPRKRSKASKHLAWPHKEHKILNSWHFCLHEKPLARSYKSLWQIKRCVRHCWHGHANSCVRHKMLEIMKLLRLINEFDFN